MLLLLFFNIIIIIIEFIIILIIVIMISMIVIIIVISHAPVNNPPWLMMYVDLVWITSGSSVHPNDLLAKPSIMLTFVICFLIYLHSTPAPYKGHDMTGIWKWELNDTFTQMSTKVHDSLQTQIKKDCISPSL